MQHQEALDSLAAERYLLGEMDDRERDAFEEHVFSCAACAEDIRAGARMRDGVRAGLLKPPAAKPRGWRPAVVIPWAAAASLAVLAGYQTVQMRQTIVLGGGPVALAPVTLRSSTRGAGVTVSPGPGGFVTLAVVLDGARSDKGIQYELRRGDQGKVASGAAPNPVAGAPLLLMVPAALLNPPGEYVLQVQDTNGPGLTPEEYRFSVVAR